MSESVLGPLIEDLEYWYNCYSRDIGADDTNLSAMDVVVSELSSEIWKLRKDT